MNQSLIFIVNFYLKYILFKIYFYYKIYFLQYVVSGSMLQTFLVGRSVKIEFFDSKRMFANS